MIRAVKTILSIPSQESHASAHAAFLRADAGRLRPARASIDGSCGKRFAARFAARIGASRISGGFRGETGAKDRTVSRSSGLL